MRNQRLLLALAAAILIVGGIVSSGAFGLNWNFFNRIPGLKFGTNPKTITELPSGEKIKVTTEESVVIDVVEKASPSVVTVSMTATRQVGEIFQFDPFNPLSPFGQRGRQQQPTEQDIGTGFVVSADGFIVTNKHVVSDATAKYKIITKDDKTFTADRIYRDPVNDLAIIKIAASGLTPIELGDSDKIKVGQLAIAIGTALGEFRNTVTTGVISGVGRGITAGSPFEGYAERLDNVIQTDAAINPGNSGGPLLNSSGQVIGINTAVSQEGQNVGFALPINVVKDALDNFNKTGQFNRPYLGVRYKVVTKDIALLNDVPEGAYIMEVVDGSPAQSAGLQAGDIITKIGDIRLIGDKAELSKVIGLKKAGEHVTLQIWRDGKESTKSVTLGTQDGR